MTDPQWPLDRRITISDLQTATDRGERWTMLTAYDALTARDVDAQILVWQDRAGLTPGRLPRFVKRYADIGSELARAVSAYVADVATGRYPSIEHSYG